MSFRASLEEKESLARKVAAATQSAKTERKYISAELFYQKLNPLQKRFEIAGKNHKLRHIESCNRVGKTIFFSCETAFHATGDYPENWQGRVFSKPVEAVVLSENTRSQRESTQKYILGPENDWGSGFIPKPAIVGKPIMRAGCPGVVDYVFVRHKSGGVSKITFQSADQEPGTLAGSAIDLFHDDEDIGLPHFTECLRGTTTTGGIGYGAYTPLITTPLVLHLHNLHKAAPHVLYLESRTVRFEDITHMNAEEKDAFIRSVPEHQRLARLEGGANFRGAGLVYPVNYSSVVVDSFDVPGAWKRIAGMDIGTVEGTAGVWIARDPMTMTLYIYDEFYATTNDVPQFVAGADPNALAESFYDMVAHQFQQRGYRIPVAWPHDGQKGTALKRPTVVIYRDEKHLNMVPEPVTLKDGTVSDGIAMCLNLFQTGRLKIMRKCAALIECLQTYQYDSDGGIKRRQKDHLPDAMRYAIMKFDRYAGSAGTLQHTERKPVYSSFRAW